jgi:Holliday junction resolvase
MGNIMTESEIQKEILDWLRRSGWKAWKNHVGPVRVKGARTFNQKKGSPDIEAIKNGIFLALEVKTGKGKLDPDQIIWLEDIARHGGVSVVAHSLETAMLGVTKKTAKGAIIDEVYYSKDFGIRSH